MPAPELPESLSDWPPDWRDAFEERAGIMEYDGGLPRYYAEEMAEADLREDYERRLKAHNQTKQSGI